jgi:hypothetical protein
VGRLVGVAGAWLFVLVGARRRRWRGWRGWLALKLTGFASGCALAWQYRQMLFACRDPWEWTMSLLACVFALVTVLLLARWIAARLAGITQPPGSPAWLRFGWLFVLALYGLLLVFDGRYRDLPLGVFELPCLGYALVYWLSSEQAVRMPALEERFLAAWLPVLAAIVVLQEAGVTPVAWLWLGLNLLLALPVLLGWRRARQHLRLYPQQA